MSTRYVPFESKSGFKSPGFSVNENGDLTVSGNIDTTGSFKINGVPIIDPSDSIIGLDPVIQRALGLKEIGTLEYLNVSGDLVVSNASTPYIRIQGGIGNIDNITIGAQSPADGNFTSLNVGPGDSTGELTVDGDIYITKTPTLPTHATRKDYVDARVSAFAIAFGA
jgi:hypothetical protein